MSLPNQHGAFDQTSSDLESILSDFRHAEPVSQGRLHVEFDLPPRRPRRVEARRMFRFNGDDRDARFDGLQRASNPGEQAATTDRHNYGVEARHLARNLEPDSALAGDD